MNLNLPEIRQKIHENPELSGMERNTAHFLMRLFKKFSFSQLIKSVGGNGLAVVFDSKKSGSTIMFRAELDALRITETNRFSYRSRNAGVSHKCGHDGHIAILIGLAQKLSEMKFCGKIILLFQPAEETAEGATFVLKDPKFKKLTPDYIFALHNLPGFEKGSIILKNGCFSATSIGMIINLEGETSHAGHPENGNNPAPALAKIIDELSKLPKNLSDFALITIIYAKLGEITFGTSPGKAVIMATFRSYSKSTLELMQQQAILLVRKVAQTHKLEHSVEWKEYFPEIVNDNECVKIIEKAAKNAKKKVIYRKQPFSWTEDFSYFTQQFKGAFFGLGAGEEHPQLHNSNYDFPDEIINDGVEILVEIVKEITRKT